MRSPNSTDSAEAHDLVKAIAISASPNTIASVQDWGRANASYWLWATEAHKEAFARKNEQLLSAATDCVTEFQVSRGYSFGLMGEHISKMRIAANAQITGFWQGGQLGIISFFLEAAKARGVISDSAVALRDGWGLIQQLPSSALSKLLMTFAASRRTYIC